MKQLKITLTSVMVLLLMLLFLALTACSPAAEETFMTPTATTAQFVEVEEEATAQKSTSTATVMAAEATSTATKAVAEATKTTSAEVAEAKASPTVEATKKKASPTAEAAQEQASPTAEAAQEQASPTVEVAQEQASPTVEVAQEQASPTVEAAQEQASPTAEAFEGNDGEIVTASDATATPIVEEAAPTETVAVATWNPLPTKTPDTVATVAPATVAPATVAPATVAPATPTAVISSPEATAIPDIAGEASDMAGLLNQIANPNQDDAATTDIQEILSYVDRELAIAFDVPADWTMEGEPGAYGNVYAPEKVTSLNFSVLNEESNTLELALEEIKGGAFGPHISEALPVKVGQFDGLRLNLSPNEVEGGPTAIWLMMTPVGRAIGFIPQGDLTLIEPILSTVRGIR